LNLNDPSLELSHNYRCDLKHNQECQKVTNQLSAAKEIEALVSIKDFLVESPPI
jgi:hypothetical protein